MSSSEKALRYALRGLIDYGLCAIDELRYAAYQKAEWLLLDSIDSGTDLERLLPWLSEEEAWGRENYEYYQQPDVTIPEHDDAWCLGYTKAFANVIRHIADEFGVQQKEANETG